MFLLRNSSSHAYTLSCPSKEEALALQGTIGFSFHFIYGFGVSFSVLAYSVSSTGLPLCLCFYLLSRVTPFTTGHCNYLLTVGVKTKIRKERKTEKKYKRIIIYAYRDNRLFIFSYVYGIYLISVKFHLVYSKKLHILFP